MRKLFILLLLETCLSLLYGQNKVIQGHITKPDHTPISGVEVLLNDGVQRTTTNDEGYYQFTRLSNDTYTVRPYYNKDFSNGVNALDIERIKLHINNTAPFETIYQKIAADINNSHGVTTFDVVLLNRLVNGLDTTIVNNTSWRFLPADFDLVNYNVVDTFPEEKVVDIAGVDTETIDFLGIKVGDVTGDAIASLDKLNYIRGIVSRDESGNCVAGAGTPPFEHLLIRAIGTQDTFYTLSQLGGIFSLVVPDDTYHLEIVPPNNYWKLCNSYNNLNIKENTDTSFALVLIPEVECPFLEVNIATPSLRRCFNNTYHVQYCNSGTATADDAYVEIELDPFLVFKSSSIPGTLVRDHVYRFDLGSVDVGVCQTFTFVAEVSCDAALGQTHCVEANIYPHTDCSTPNSAWDGASLKVQGSCNNDSVQFQIKNVGANMSASTRSIVIEDDLVMMQRSIQLNAGATETLAFPANGQTRYLQVTQPNGHPFSTFASVAVEGCGTGNDGTVTYGVVNNYPQADEAPFKDIECQDNLGAFDPNDKQAVPAGITENHLIEANTGLDYLIRFQNTGTDTAFTVVVRDTLSEKLNPASIVPGASSHPYKYYLENNVLTFLFSNIELPDSNVNEAASHGFIKFKIQQKPDLPDGTLIENKAGIYFDFNTPVITNTVWHTIGKAYFNIISSVENLSPNLDVTVAPNPFRDVARIELHCKDFIQGTFRLYDAYGRLVRTQAIQNKVFDFHANSLTAGFYTFEILLNKERVSVGKLMIQHE